MLTLVHIENIALIEEADIHFHQGFNVLTGETGAGKSIVVDSISAVLGERTSRDLIRTGSKSALVSAVFSQVELPQIAVVLEEMGQEASEEVILQREIRSDGKNICRVNGKPVTVTQLKELGQLLLNIHGQHDGQQLLDPCYHLGYLDSFGKTASLLAEFLEEYKGLATIKKEIASLQRSEGERERLIDSLSFQINELERAELSPGEDSLLEQRKDQVRNAGKMIEGVQRAQSSIFGDDDTLGILSLLREGAEALHSLGKIAPNLGELADNLEKIGAEVEDVGETLRDSAREMDVTPEELDQMEERLDVLYRLKKKYGDTVEEMVEYLAKCRKQLDDISYADDRIAQLEKKLGKQRESALKKGRILREKRKIAAASLTLRVVEELRQLDMPKVQFAVEFTEKTGQDAMDETGMDDIQFLMSANVGENLKPIQRVASGGELARIMLAMKNVLATDDGIASLVFDEVDAGVSGRAAQKVAEKMADVARYKQVLCVTHLPQIAAMADAHLRVEKGENDGRTHTEVIKLEREERRGELARLIGGTVLTEAVLTSGEELLTQADKYKEESRQKGKKKEEIQEVLEEVSPMSQEQEKKQQKKQKEEPETQGESELKSSEKPEEKEVKKRKKKS